jgi:plasmid stabilization system protein ParE
MQVEFSLAAERDLKQIALFIATSSPARATSFALELRGIARQLGEMPGRFEAVAERKGEPVRRMPYRNYVIFYRHDERRVAVLRIVHGASVTEDFIDNLR